MTVPIGVQFQGIDKGLGTMLNRMTKMTRQYQENQEELNKAFIRTTRGATRMKEALKPLGEDLKQLGTGLNVVFQSIAKDGNASSSALETMRAGARKTAKQVLAGFADSEKGAKELRKAFVDASFWLGIGEDSIANSYAAARRNGLEFLVDTKDEMIEWARIVDVAGGDGQALANTVGTWTNEFGLAEDEIKPLLGSIVAIGKRADIGTDALNSMVDITTAIGPAMRENLEKMGPEAFKKMLKSTVALGGAMQKTLGGEVQENMTGAIALTQKLTETQLDWNKMFSGIGEFPDFLQDIGVATGDFSVAMKMMEEDSGQFMLTLRKSMEQMDPESAKVFGQHMATALGGVDPRLAAFFKSTKDTGGILEEIGADVTEADATAALKGLADAYDAGLTKLDVLDKRRESANQVLRDEALGYDKLNKKMELVIGKYEDMAREIADGGKSAHAVALTFGGDLALALETVGPEVAAQAEHWKSINDDMGDAVGTLKGLGEGVKDIGVGLFGVATGGGIAGILTGGGAGAAGGTAGLAGLASGLAAVLVPLAAIAAALGSIVMAFKFMDTDAGRRVADFWGNLLFEGKEKITGVFTGKFKEEHGMSKRQFRELQMRQKIFRELTAQGKSGDQIEVITAQIMAEAVGMKVDPTRVDKTATSEKYGIDIRVRADEGTEAYASGVNN